jgi:hypothetical protein
MISALLFSLVAASAPAASPSDGWLAWQGCWRAYGDEDPSSLLCIVPEGAGARLVTVSNGTIRSEMRLVSDGSARPFDQEGCKGTQRAVWSSDQQRLFVNSTMTCGEALPRTVSGIMTMQSRTEWTNVEAVITGSLTSTRVVRYAAVEMGEIPEEIAAPLRANKLARETARYNATADVDLDDVQEAVRHANESAVTAWLTEMNQPFELTGKKLVALADAGVPPAVIDVMVAVSNPQYFAVATQPDRIDNDDYTRRARRPRAMGSCYDPFYDPWLGTMTYSYGYNRCYRYGGHFAPYGSGWDYGYGLPPIIVVRNTENPRAKVTREGYTKGDSSTSSPSPTKTSTSGSSGTSDSGSSSSSTGRTAKPRDN